VIWQPWQLVLSKRDSFQLHVIVLLLIFCHGLLLVSRVWIGSYGCLYLKCKELFLMVACMLSVNWSLWLLVHASWVWIGPYGCLYMYLECELVPMVACISSVNWSLWLLASVKCELVLMVTCISSVNWSLCCLYLKCELVLMFAVSGIHRVHTSVSTQENMQRNSFVSRVYPGEILHLIITVLHYYYLRQVNGVNGRDSSMCACLCVCAAEWSIRPV